MKVPNAYRWQRKNLWNTLVLFFRHWGNLPNEIVPKFIDPLNIYISTETRIGGGTVIEPNVWIEGKTVIGKNCKIRFGSVIIDSIIGDNVIIAGARVENSEVGDNAELGYTAQLKRTQFGARSKMMHHGYLGDAVVGEDVNIGAGVVTANYDGETKHQTTIGNDAFIGTNVCLVAPITVPEGAMIAAGSTVTGKDELLPYHLAIARPKFHISRSKLVTKDERSWRLTAKEEDSALT
ncbi:MAG: hypothetical protein Q7R91_02140 [bacterium]|nr:hypothetical protein [bacterium]